MIVSHTRRFVFFPDPLDGSPVLSRGFLPFGDTEVSGFANRHGHLPFACGMSPHEAEWTFDGLGLAYRSYLRIAVVQNPFVRMVRLYNRIAAADPVWLRQFRTGFGGHDFFSWLSATRPNGVGAGGRHSPPWRRYGAWSARHWCGDYISHVIRQEAIEEDLTGVLSILGIAPAFDRDFKRSTTCPDWESYYDDRSISLMNDRYGWDIAQYGYRSPARLKAG